MQKKKRRIISSLLAFCMAFSSFTMLSPVTAGAEEAETPQIGHGEAIYQNDFEGANPMDGFISVPDGKFTVVERNNGHALKGNCAEYAGYLTYGGESSWKNYVISVDMNTSSVNFNTNSKGASAGILFNAQDNTHFYHFRIDSGSGAQLYKWNGGSATSLQSVPFKFEKDKDYNLTVVADGAFFRCYIDGNLLISYVDNTNPYLGGKVGFRTYNCTTYFDNLNVWNLAEPQVDITSVTEGATLDTVPVTLSGTAKNAHSAELTIDGGAPIALDIFDDAYSYTLYPRNKAYTVKVTVYNYDKSISKEVTRSFTVQLPEGLTLGAKLDKIKNVAVDSPILLTFDRPLDTDTLSGITLVKKGGDAVDASVEVYEGDDSGRTIAITPSTPLLMTTTYDVVIAPTVQDYLGYSVGDTALTLSFDTIKDINTLPLLEKDKEGQTVLSLNGDWKFMTDPSKNGEGKGWYQLSDTASWDTLKVPGNWDLENAYANYKGMAWYGRSFTISDDYIGYPVYLDLTAVYHDCKIWINGREVGTHSGGYTSFQFRIDEFLKFGEENTIAIRVDNTYSVGAWWKWGGIAGDARLLVNNTSKFDWQHIVSTPNLEDGSAALSFEYKINNQSFVDKNYTVVSEVYDKATGEKVGEVSTDVTVKPTSTEADQRFTASLSLSADKVKLWHFDDPNLYTVKTSLKSGSDVVNFVQDNIGIREIRMDDTYFYLNGEKIRMTGADRVWDDRVNGQMEPDYVIMRDIDYMKTMGMNCARMSHVPMSKNILNYCDEVGFMLICESNVWGGPPGKTADGQYKCIPWYREMIERDYNHPSIFAWSIGNEMHGGNQSTKDYAKFMVDYIKTELDSSRFVTEVSLSAQNPNNPDNPQGDSVYYSDFICCNFYGGFRDNVQKIRNTYPDKPIFVSEYGNGQTSEIPDKNNINPQNILNQWGDLPYVFGASIWTLNDYRSNYSGTPLGQNRVWGATTVWGDKKIGFEALRKASSPIKALTVNVSGDADTKDSVVVAVIETKIKDITKDLPAYPLRGAMVKWETLDKYGNVIASGLDVIPDMEADGSSHMTTVTTKAPQGGIGALRATVIDSLGYEVAETFKYLQAPGTQPEIKEVVTAGTSARVLFDGIQNATDYTVTATDGEKTFTGTAKMNRYVDFTGLTAGKEYTFTLTAKNEAGAGVSSEEAKAVTNADFDTLPPIIWHTEPIDGAFFVGYSVKDLSDTYEIEYGTESGSYTQTLSGITTEGAVKVSGLVGGETYYYRMRSLSGETPSAWSEEIAVTVETAAQKRNTPVVKGAAAGESTVSLTIDPVWKSTGYTVKYGESADALNSTLTINRAEVAQLTIPNLKNNTTYYFSVAARNGDVLSDYSAPVSAATSSNGGNEEVIAASIGSDTLTYLPYGDTVQNIMISAVSTFTEAKILTVKVENLPAGVTVPDSLTFTAEKDQSVSFEVPVTIVSDIARRTYEIKVSILDGEKVLTQKTVTLDVKNFELLYSDDFTNVNTDDYTSVGTGTLEQGTDGTLLANVTEKDKNLLVIVGDADWSDYVVESDMKMLSDSYMGGGVSAGIVFRYQDDGNFYHARIDRNAQSNDVTFQVYKWTRAAGATSASATQLKSIPISSAWNDTYHLRAVVIGDKAELYLDDKLMATVDVTIPNGKMGYRAYSAPTQFDNLRIYRFADPAPAETTAQDVADGITEITAPAKGAEKLILPTVPEGFTVSIKSSSNEAVIDLEGNITPPAVDTDVTLTLTVSKGDDTAETRELTVTVPGVGIWKILLKQTIDAAELEAENLPEHIIPAVKEKFLAALENAKTLYAKADATDEELKNADDLLITMMHYLSFTANPEDLQKAVDEADGIIASGKYVADKAFEDYKALRDEAKALLLDEAATDTEYGDMIAKLAEAKAKLTLKPVETLDLSVLEHQINLSQDAYNNLSKYFDGEAKEAFKAAYEKAVQVLEDARKSGTAVTQAEVNKAAQDLHNARPGLRLIPNKAELENLLNRANAKDLSKYTKESGAVLLTAIDMAQAVYDDPLATVEQVKAAEAVLNAAMDNLVPVKNGGAEEPGNKPGDGNDTPTGDTQPIGVLSLGILALGVLIALKKKK